MLTWLLGGEARLEAAWGEAADGTRRELIAWAERVAGELGTPRGRVVLSCRTARAFVPGLLGAWQAGATVELLPNVQPATLDRVDDAADVAAVLHDDPARQGRSAKAIYLPGICPRDAGPTSAGAWRAVAPGWPQLAVCMTTSGTTERPKQVHKSMDQLLRELEVLATVIPPARCVLSTVPLSHLYGLLFGALLPLRMGARIVSHQALLPADLAALLVRDSVDLLVSTPAHLRAMADATMPRGLRVVSSGARLSTELHLRLAEAHGWDVTDVLGSTETGGVALRRHPMSAWTPLPGVRVTAPDGHLAVASPWGERPVVELEEQIELRVDGTFHYLGRNHELIKIAGKRADAAAIEATVRAVPNVTDVAVLVHTVVGKEPRLAVAFCAPADALVGREEVCAAIRRQFDAVFVPKIVKRVEVIPRTERGKLSAEALHQVLGLPAAGSTREVPLRKVELGRYLADIPATLEFFRGHFDALEILPGAVLIERVVWPAARAELPELTALRGIRRLRFRRPVLPGQQLSITLQRTTARPELVSFEVSCAAAQVASGQLVVE